MSEQLFTVWKTFHFDAAHQLDAGPDGDPRYRLGFVIGESAVLDRIEDGLGPWAVSGPALTVATRLMETDTTAIHKAIETRKAGLDAVLSAAGERASVLLSTHQTEDVSALCDRVVVLDGGRIRFNGAVLELVATAAGRVWLADSPNPAAQASWRTGTGRYRHVGDAPPGAELVEPSLEDAYLLLVGDAAGVTEVAA